MFDPLRATASWLIGLSLVLTVPAVALAGKEHCRTIELTGAAGPASADIVDIEVTDYLGNILDRSCKRTVENNECADALAARLVSQWGNGSESLSQVGCATDLGDQTCGKNLDMDACVLNPLDEICTVFCRHKYKAGKVKGGKKAIAELAMLGQCPAAPPNGEKADRGEFKKFPKIDICCFEAKDEGVLADPSSFDYTDPTHCKGKPLGKTLVSPKRIEISLFDRIDRPNVIGDGIFFEPKLPDNSLDVPVGVSSRQISLDPIGIIQRPGTNLLDCRASVAKGVDALIRTSVAVLTRCHEAVMDGKIVADCNTVNAQSDPDGRVAAAEQALGELAAEACDGPDVASEGPLSSPSVYGLRECPAPCAAIDVGVCSFGLFGNPCVSDRHCDTSPGAADGKCGSWSDATDCSSCLVENAVTAAVAQLFGTPGPGTGNSREVVKCFDVIGKSLEFLAKVNGTETLACQKKADRAKTALPENAPYCKDADLKGNRNKAVQKTDIVLEKGCAGVDIASFGLCGGATTIADLQACMRSNARELNDTLARGALPEQIDLCGNQVVDPGEDCDGTDGLCPGNCLPDCTCPPLLNCGNEELDAGEECDDGNLVDGDGCDSNCTFTACGNGIVTEPEECDDGNPLPNDGCNQLCEVEQCGDAVVQPGIGEECDDGNGNDDNDVCTSACTIAVCGDGVTCTASACTSGPGGTPEQCDGADDGACPGQCQPDCSCAPPPTCPQTGPGSDRACSQYGASTACAACCDAAPGGCATACLMAIAAKDGACTDANLNLQCTIEVNQVCAAQCC